MGYVYVGLMIYEALFYWINYGLFGFTLVNLFVIVTVSTKNTGALKQRGSYE